MICGLVDKASGLGFHADCRCEPGLEDPKWPILVMTCEYDDSIEMPGLRIDNERAALDGVLFLGKQGHYCG